jgi:hypothetical protein
MPSYQKQPIETILDNQEVQTSMTKVTKFVSGLVNGVEAKAGWCSRDAKMKGHWWGIQIHLNDCIVNDLKYSGGAASIVAGAFGGTPCSWVCGVIAAFIGLNVAYIDFLNSGCKGDGVMFNRTWSGASWFWPVC